MESPLGASRRKVMAIGLDGLTLELLLPLVRRGELPTFARLLARGRHGVLRSVGNTSTGPTWASFATGCYPRRHGILHDYHHEPDGYGLRPTRGGDRRGAAFWEVAGDAGFRVIVLNVPHTFPVGRVNGVILAGIDAPGEWAAGFAYPPESWRELKRHVGSYMIDSGAQSYFLAQRAGASSTARALAEAEVARETEGRTRAAEHFMGRLDWHLMVVVYSLPDLWQHYFWAHLAEPGAPGRAVIEGGYRLMDEHLARLLAHLPDDGLAIVFSDHGFGPLCGTRDDLNAWLAAHSLLTFRDKRRSGLARRVLGGALGQVRRHTSYRRRQQLLATLPPLRRAIDTSLRMGAIDWAGTQAYAAIDHTELWLNVRGRQRQGTVDPADYDATCSHLANLLLDWRDAEGRRLIKDVHIRPYDGVALPCGLPPDLALEWDPSTARPNLHPAMSGDHTLEGTLIVAGGGVAQGSLPACSLVDVAPLALAGLGLPAAGMDGLVPAGLLAPAAAPVAVPA